MAKFFPRTMYKVLNTFEPDKQYSVKDLLELLPEMNYKGLEYNLRHYHSNHLLKRTKENTITWNIDNINDIKVSKYYLYSIIPRGIRKLAYLRKHRPREKTL